MADPSGTYQSRRLAEAALRRIGSYTVNMTEADAVELEEALFWMDIAVAHLAETEECQWLVPLTITFPLDGVTPSYDLSSFTNYPDQGILYPIAAYRTDGTNDSEIELVRRTVYEDLSAKNTAGPPNMVYVDRLATDKNVFVYPVPPDSNVWSLRLLFQQFAPNMVGPAGKDAGTTAHGFSQGWQLWIIKQTAYEISGGPVRKLQAQERNEIKAEADEALGRLMAFSSREKISTPRRTQRYRY